MTDLDPAELLDHAVWLRRLASRLVGDASAADDVAQETWLAALRSPPRTDRPVRPWLRHVLRNAARFRWRGETKRATREQAVAALAEVAAPATDELLARHELQQRLARLVGELAEPYRTAVLLRFAEGLTPAAIAAQLGVPAGTVRSRVHEGLQRLRAGLDDLHGGNRRTWVLALGPLAARGTPGPVATAGSSALAAWMMLAVAGAICALVVLQHVTAPTREVRPLRARPERPRLASAAAAAAAAVAAADAGAAEQALTAEGPPGWFAQEGAPARGIAGRVTDAGAPVGALEVQLSTELTRAGLGAPVVARTAADGSFAFPPQPAGVVTVAAAAPDRIAAIAHVDLRDPTTRADAIVLALHPCAGALYGTVTDADGAPIAHARLRRDDVIGTETDAAGAYALCMAPNGITMGEVTVVVRASGYGALQLAAGVPGRVQHDFVLVPEAVVTGRVTAEAGTAVPYAVIASEVDVGARRGLGESAASQRTVADASGQFRIAGLVAGAHVLAGSARGLVASPTRVALVPGATQEVALVLHPAIVVRGRVTQAGRPVGGAVIQLAGDAKTDAVSQADGSFVLDGVPAGTWTVTASPYRVSSGPAVVAAGTGAPIAVQVEPLGRVSGTIRRQGRAVAAARLCAGLAGRRNTCAVADAAGGYVLAGLEPGAYTLFADSSEAGAFARDVIFTLALGEQQTRDVELAAGAQVSGDVVDGHGAPVAGAVVSFVQPASPGHLFDRGRCITSPAGAFACRALEPGTYTIAASPAIAASRAFPAIGGALAPVVIASGDTRIAGLHVVVDTTPLALAGALLDGAGVPIGDARVRAWAEGADTDALVPPTSTATDGDGRFRLAGLAPGAYALEARAPDGTTVTRHGIVAGDPSVALVLDVAAQCHGAAPAAGLTAPPARVAWDERVELVGWTAPARVARGTPFDVELTYRVLRPLDRAWTVVVHLDGVAAGEASDRPARVNADHDPSCPTTTWRPGDYVRERFTTTIATAPGPYALAVGFFAGASPQWTNLPVTAAPPGAADAWHSVRLATLTVE